MVGRSSLCIFQEPDVPSYWDCHLILQSSLASARHRPVDVSRRFRAQRTHGTVAPNRTSRVQDGLADGVIESEVWREYGLRYEVRYNVSIEGGIE